MSANATTTTPTGRKKAIGHRSLAIEQSGSGVPPLNQEEKPRRDASAALGHDFQNTSAPKGRKIIAQGNALGTGRRKLTQKALMAAPYLLPPLAEQTRIVAEVERRLSVVEELEAAVCRRLSLIYPMEIPGNQTFYSVPQLARGFAHKKLQGDPDRLVIQQDLATLQKFGVVSGIPTGDDSESRLL
jgi:hypothetical protein